MQKRQTIIIEMLSNISKIYERIMFKQISEYFEPILSKFQCGFSKGFKCSTLSICNVRNIEIGR